MLNQFYALVDPPCVFDRACRVANHAKCAIAAALTVAVLASPASAGGGGAAPQKLIGNSYGFPHAPMTSSWRQAALAAGVAA